MTLQEILNKNITNGRFFGIEAETEKKRKGITYRKRTTLTAQFGVNYANVASVQDKLVELGAIKESETDEKPVTLCYALENILAITYNEQAAA